VGKTTFSDVSWYQLIFTKCSTAVKLPLHITTVSLRLDPARPKYCLLMIWTERQAGTRYCKLEDEEQKQYHNVLNGE